MRARYEFEDGSSSWYRSSTTHTPTVIGRGAFGRVVLARERHGLKRKVAMKVVKKSLMRSETLVNEVEVLSHVIGHPNIIHLLDVLSCDGEWFIVTEIGEGGELLDRLQASGPMNEAKTSKLALHILSALKHVHACGYVHLDIKPENVVYVHDHEKEGRWIVASH